LEFGSPSGIYSAALRGAIPIAIVVSRIAPTHEGIICRKLAEGMIPPDIARATGHTLQAVDNFLVIVERN